MNPEIFIRLWTETADGRMKGVFKSFHDNVNHICKQAGNSVDDTTMALAYQIRLDMIRNEMEERKDSVQVLSTLKEKGYRIGLISDCSHEATLVWKQTSFPRFFNAVVFSCLVGLTKPDPRIYQFLLNKLEVKPQDCLFFGDGGDMELAGAQKLGIHPVLLKVPRESNTDVYRANPEEWSSPVITSLLEIYDLLE